MASGRAFGWPTLQHLPTRDGRISRAGNLIGAGVAADDASDSSLADQESNKSLLESDEDTSSEHSQSSEDRLQLLPARGRGKGGGASTRVARWRNLHFQHFRQHFQTRSKHAKGGGKGRGGGKGGQLLPLQVSMCDHV